MDCGGLPMFNHFCRKAEAALTHDARAVNRRLADELRRVA